MHMQLHKQSLKNSQCLIQGHLYAHLTLYWVRRCRLFSDTHTNKNNFFVEKIYLQYFTRKIFFLDFILYFYEKQNQNAFHIIIQKKQNGDYFCLFFSDLVRITLTSSLMSLASQTFDKWLKISTAFRFLVLYRTQVPSTGKKKKKKKRLEK